LNSIAMRGSIAAMGRRRTLAALSLAAAFGTAAACSPPADPWEPPEAAGVESLYAPHGEPGRFVNPWSPFRGSPLDFLRWQLSPSAWGGAGDFELPRVANDGSSLAGVEHSAAITWIGHASFAVHDDADVFLTDPHFGPRALLPRRRVPPGIPLESVPGHAFAVISHNHYDHLDEPTVEALPDTVTWYVPLGLGAWFRERGRRAVVELDWWESAQHGRFRVTCLPSQHWSRRVGQAASSTLWCSWLLDSGERRYYFAGDTGWFHGFAEFGRRFGPIDVAMLPIGAYAPRWFMRYQHLDPADAVQAFQELRARHLLAMHWGTFDLTDEPLGEPPEALARAVAQAGVDPETVHLLAVGEEWELPEAQPEPVRPPVP
jgi:N-acyl-phosphatidylethanolamine-hydrolysing phospholipase D